jgi:hypothetical protein
MAKKPIADEPVRVIEECRYEFTTAELNDLGARLAQAAQRRFDVKREKDSATAHFGAALKTADDVVADLAHKRNNGYEMRPTECILRFDSPRPGLKEFVRTDNGEVARTEAMGPDDQQRRLPLEPEDKRLQ